MGILVCMGCSFVATDIRPVKNKHDIEFTLKLQMILTSIVVVCFSGVLVCSTASPTI